MAEGGLFAWKIQSLDRSRGPAGDYRNLHRPLPDPPKDMHWIQDLDTHEWHLTKILATVEDDTNTNRNSHRNTSLENDDGVVLEATTEQDELPDFIEHKLQPTDTFQGLCLRYKLTPTELRRANGGFSGTNLHLVAHDPLRIPVTAKYRQQTHIPCLEAPVTAKTPAQKIRLLQAKVPKLAATEAKCYLELNDWNMAKAVENAREDGF